MMKAQGYSGEKAFGLISIRIVPIRDRLIYDFLTLSDLLWFELIEVVRSFLQ